MYEEEAHRKKRQEMLNNFWEKRTNFFEYWEIWGALLAAPASCIICI